MQKLFWTGGLLVLAAVVLGVWATYSRSVGHPMGPTATPTNILGGTATTSGDLEYTESHPYYRVSLLYPAATPLVGQADLHARQYIEEALKDELNDYSDTVKDLTPDILPPLGSGYQLELVATYQKYQGHGTVSYFYTIFWDSGGAHPNTFFKTFVFDQNGKAMSLADILGANPNWLTELSLVVSNDVVAQMKQRLGQDDVTGAIFADGLAPKEDNFADWFIDGDTLVVEIPPYQVAAYALGSFEVRIPLSSLNK